MSWLEKIRSSQLRRKTAGHWRERNTLQSAQGPKIKLGNRWFTNFCSNDYLGLAVHPAIQHRAAEAVQRWGSGSGASHLVCGHLEPHQRLEDQIASHVGAEKAIVFSTGYMANLAIPQTFLHQGDLLLQDRLNHASLLDAGKLCDARMIRYQHADVASLKTRIARHLRHQSQRPSDDVHRNISADQRLMIMTDSVFSMDGDLAPLGGLKEVADQHEGLLVVDDAHAFGVLGASGAGSLEYAGIPLTGNVLLMGTLGKAAGSFGAFVAGDTDWIEHLIQFARPYIYTTALPPSVIAATSASIELFGSDDTYRNSLNANIQRFRKLMFSQGTPESLPILQALLPSQTAIQPIVIGDSPTTLAASEFLQSKGMLVKAIRFPTVPSGSARLRITLTASHQIDQIEQLVDALCSATLQKILTQSGDIDRSPESGSEERP